MTLPTHRLPTLTRRTLLATAACTPAMAWSAAPVKVAAIFSLPFHHLWVSCMHLPLLQAQARGEIKYKAYENVHPSEYPELLEQLASQGTELMMGESHWGDQVVREAARKQPEVAYLWWSLGEPQGPNFSVFDNCIPEPIYLAGMLAGALSRKGHLGLVSGSDMPHSRIMMNAFIQGAQTVAPGIRWDAGSIDSWYNPVRAERMTRTMLERGADVFFALTHAGVVETALSHQALAFNGMANQQHQFPNSVVAAALWHTEPMLRAAFAHLRQKQFGARSYANYTAMAHRGSSLSSWSHFAPKVPKQVQDLIQFTSEQMQGGRFQLKRNSQLKMTVPL